MIDKRQNKKDVMEMRRLFWEKVDEYISHEELQKRIDKIVSRQPSLPLIEEKGGSMKRKENWSVTLRPKHIMVFLILFAIGVFGFGMLAGVKLTKNANNIEVSMKLKNAILSGKSQTVDKFITTPHRDWKQDNPVTMIWLRDRQIAGAGDNTLQKGKR